jgi:hypothetical protein
MTRNDSGKYFLVEDCQKLDISDLLRDYKKKIKETILNSQLEILDKDILITSSKTGNGGFRFWFICPKCKRRAGVLLKHPFKKDLGCRVCLKLKYKSSKFKGMIEE